MPKFYDLITETSSIHRKIGAAAVVPAGFRDMSAAVIAQCSFIQSLIQQVIYVTHGAELSAAHKALKDFPSPRARIEFLCKYPYSKDDPVLLVVFNYSRALFAELYEFRNILAHEVWSSSPEFVSRVLLTTLEEEARILLASGRVMHKDDATPKEVYDATVRYIRSIKVVSREHLSKAIKEASLCSWVLMHIAGILGEEDPNKRAEARRAFLVYKGTRHLFGDAAEANDVIEYSSSRMRTIKG